MGFKYEINGEIWEFDSDPTDKDIDNIASQSESQSTPRPGFNAISEPLSPTGQSFPLGKALRGVPGALETAEATTQFGKETVKVLAKTVSAKYSGGLLEFAIRRMNKDEAEKIFGEQETTPGKIASFGGQLFGMATGVMQKGAKFAAGKIIPKLSKDVAAGGIGLIGAGDKAIRARKNAVALNKILRSSVEGGLFAGGQIIDQKETGEEQLRQQAGQIPFGAAIGGLVEFAGQGFVKAGRAFKQWKRKATTPAVQKITESTKELKKVEKGGVVIKKEAQLRRIERLKERANIEKSQGIELEESYRSGVLKDTTDKMNEQIQLLDEGLQQEILRETDDIQNALPKLYKRTSDVYSDRLDEISEALAKNGDDITIGEVNKFADNAIKEMDDALITSGPAREGIQKLKDKYAIRSVGESQFIRGAAGEVTGSLKSNVDDVVPFRTIVDDIKNVKRSMSSGGRTGNKIFTQEDLGISILENNFGNSVAKRSKDFADLQKAYGPMARMKTKSNTIFHPFKADFEKNRAVSTLRNIAESKGTKVDEQNLIEAIEGGLDFAKGIGPITKESKRLGKELIAARNRVKPVIDAIRKSGESNVKSIDDRLTNRLNVLTAREDFINANYAAQEKLIDDVFTTRLKELGIKEAMIKNLKIDLNKFSKFKQIIVGGAVGAAASFGIVKILGLVFGGKR